jgi:hypothetical protein
MLGQDESSCLLPSWPCGILFTTLRSRRFDSTAIYKFFYLIANLSKLLSNMGSKSSSNDVLSIASTPTYTAELAVIEKHPEPQISQSSKMNSIDIKLPDDLSPGRLWVILCW